MLNLVFGGLTFCGGQPKNPEFRNKHGHFHKLVKIAAKTLYVHKGNN